MIKDFQYLAPKTLKEALTLTAKFEHKAKIIAGGQSLLVVMKQGLLETEKMIDIKGLSDLSYIKYDAKSGLKIGALTTHRELEKSSVIKKNYKVISDMEDNLATIQTRNWGTIGGNLCHADPAGDPAVVFGALGAKLKLASSKGERVVDMESFSKDYLETALQEGEMLVEIQIPPIPAHTGVSHQKLMFQKGDMGIVGAAALITLNPKDHKCVGARIFLSNCGAVPVRAKQAENALKGNVIDEKTLAKAAEIAANNINPPEDVHGTPAYRKEMANVFVRRVVKSAAESAR
jgi:carbon-monoxide dehydrogenase medium subunit